MRRKDARDDARLRRFSEVKTRGVGGLAGHDRPQEAARLVCSVADIEHDAKLSSPFTASLRAGATA